MFYYLHKLTDTISFFRIFQYITVRIVAGAGTAFILSLISGPWLIRRLRRLCRGEEERYREDSPALDALHGEAKKTTPSMGGLLIIGSVAISCCLWTVPTNPLVWLVLLTFCYMGGIGFIDDYIKKVRCDPKGLHSWTKLSLQGIWVLALMFALRALPQTRETACQLMVPFIKTPLIRDMGFACALIFTGIVVIGASNAVNLADGLDGLAVGCASSVFMPYLIMAYVAGHVKFSGYLQVPYIAGSGELSVFCGCVLGASLGFLWFNCHPAEVFMGDTGSLALGGALGAIAVLIKHELVLVFVGGVFVVEALSVILQVAWYKLKGRRVFACAPLHHHFELKKNPWSETQVTVRFWIVSIIFALMGLLLLKIR